METADNNIEQQLANQISELKEIGSKPSLYQILIYDGSHFQAGSVAFLTNKELSDLVAETEQTHSCRVQPLKFYYP
ncbi:hypothetical protein [Chamaesiphon sp.]|uniref:hypothetical protein n=1 Tax=Chamaesiphon sp. TaxID=2814140 RepID=UPI0035943AB3